MANSKRRKLGKKKTRRGGVRERRTTDRVTLRFVLVCHGGDQAIKPDGTNEFTVPADVSVAFYVPPGNVCMSYVESPYNICHNGMQVYDRYQHTELCPEYFLRNQQGETGGLYACWSLNEDYASHSTILDMSGGYYLSDIIRYIKESYPNYNIELCCYFCRTNSSSGPVYGVNDVLEKNDGWGEFKDFKWEEEMFNA